MERTIIRLSRPLLINTEDNFYQTIYGFAYNGSLDKEIIKDIDCYVGYLAGLSDWSNGGTMFSVVYPYDGIPFWIDRQGKPHMKRDAWMEGIWKKCRKKLNLSYDILEIDDSLLKNSLNEDRLIVDETFYYDLERYREEDQKYEPLF